MPATGRDAKRNAAILKRRGRELRTLIATVLEGVDATRGIYEPGDARMWNLQEETSPVFERVLALRQSATMHLWSCVFEANIVFGDFRSSLLEFIGFQMKGGVADLIFG